MRKLKKKDQRGVWRFWWGEVHGDHYVTTSQIYGSDPRDSQPTYPRRVKSRTSLQQCELELAALYTKRLRLGWEDEKPRYEKQERPVHRFFAPMLAHKYPKYQLAMPFHMQPKLDGVRCITASHQLWSRKNSAITSVPHIETAVNELLARYPWVANFDGELYLHGWVLPKISGLARLKRPSDESLKLEYHIFDYMPDNLSTTSEERMKRLASITKLPACIKIVRTELVEDQEDCDFLHYKWVQAGYEGSMLRRMASKYTNGRTSSLLKRKDFHDAEATIVRVEEGNGTWRGAVKSLGLVDSRGIGFSAGVRGELSQMQALWTKRTKLVGKICTFRYIYRDKRSGKPQLPVVINTDRWDI